jgi:hypothetical protein
MVSFLTTAGMTRQRYGNFMKAFRMGFSRYPLT